MYYLQLARPVILGKYLTLVAVMQLLWLTYLSTQVPCDVVFSLSSAHCLVPRHLPWLTYLSTQVPCDVVFSLRPLFGASTSSMIDLLIYTGAMWRGLLAAAIVWCLDIFHDWPTYLHRCHVTWSSPCGHCLVHRHLLRLTYLSTQVPCDVVFSLRPLFGASTSSTIDLLIYTGAMWRGLLPAPIVWCFDIFHDWPTYLHRCHVTWSSPCGHCLVPRHRPLRSSYSWELDTRTSLRWSRRENRSQPTPISMPSCPSLHLHFRYATLI